MATAAERTSGNQRRYQLRFGRLLVPRLCFERLGRLETAHGRGVPVAGQRSLLGDSLGGLRSLLSHPALRRVLLSVQWPDQRETNKATFPIEGRVEPGSRVFVQGEQVAVEAGGTFRAEVPLKKGKQKIAVVTVDALGRRKQVEGVVLRDDSLPDVKVKKRLWQWRR